MLLKYLSEQYGGEPPWEQRLFRDRPHLRRVVYGPSRAEEELGGKPQ